MSKPLPKRKCAVCAYVPKGNPSIGTRSIDHFTNTFHYVVCTHGEYKVTLVKRNSGQVDHINKTQRTPDGFFRLSGRR